MITVWSVCWGDKYDDYSVQRLKREVDKHLSLPHQFKCITDRNIEGVECIPPINDLPGWWGKLNLFSHDVCSDHNLYLDLDVVITGDLDQMVSDHYKSSTAMPLNWAVSGHGGCQSSVMIWTKNYNNKQIFDLFSHDDAHWPPINSPSTYWGDQEFITALRDFDKVQVNPINEDWIKSYKYHCRHGLPKDCKVVVFHGDPKPNKVDEQWFKW